MLKLEMELLGGGRRCGDGIAAIGLIADAHFDPNYAYLGTAREADALDTLGREDSLPEMDGLPLGGKGDRPIHRSRLDQHVACIRLSGVGGEAELEFEHRVRGATYEQGEP